VPQFSGLIFDFNGVLWWDNRLQEAAWRDFSAGVRGWPLSTAELAEHVHGRNNRYTLEYLSGTKLSEETAVKLSEVKERTYRRLCLAQGADLRLSPGAESLLDFLVSNEISHTIASASGKGNVNFFVENLQLARWFDVEKIVYDDGTLVGKPAPDFFLAAAERLDLVPAQCVVIEDSLSGIQAARTAEIGRVIALVGDNNDTLQGDLTHVDQVIQELSELDRSLFDGY
jgi:HAD superfamily hydrolase (TIGR01509 family)